ncbi:IclR family transcriptional regulator [Arthrobacter sp. BL-252-APC-1A]|uniref:IclR family transcriptional regulator n=1 Tax=Arthrobacter sp. BL-252-APC-1A TaxID=2606622 RepID=UPI0012B2DD1A|nr:IclR family transcriptional regulator [Arthrobacter sp. BL-252-APC-1A]MSR99425.1 IclR family transcriptional regulator [Arthrobacter sp. BL-252-APC-1A]
MDERTTGTGVQSVERVFELLELITDAGGSATLSELAASADLPLPTIHRLLRTLVGLGYVRQLPNRRYSLGPRLIRLGEAASAQLGVLAMPVLKNLVDELGETANMAVLDSDQALYIAQAPSRHSMRTFTEVGRRAHTHATGVGKAILAQLSDEQVRRVISRTGLPAATQASITDVEELLVDVSRIRQRGYSVDEQEQELGVRCFAVGVPGAPTPTAISVSGPTSRVDDAFGRRAVPLLQAAAREIAEDLTRHR